MAWTVSIAPNEDHASQRLVCDLRIASLLLERIADRAREAGIEDMRAVCLATKSTVIRLLSRLGPTTISPPDAGVVELRIDLTSTG